MPDWLPSLNALGALEAVARLQSYQRAAEALRVTPAAVKQLVAKLERAFGHSLMVRKGCSVVLSNGARSPQRDLSAAMWRLAEGAHKMRNFDAPRCLIVSDAGLLVEPFSGYVEHMGLDV